MTVINNVPRELLLTYIDQQNNRSRYSAGEIMHAEDQLRALLATAQPAADGEREAFEAACQARAARYGRTHEARYFKRSSTNGAYHNIMAQHGWEIWQLARAALPAKAEGVAVLDRFERHAIKAGECPPNSEVVLLSSLRRILAAAPVPTVRGGQDE